MLCVGFFECGWGVTVRVRSRACVCTRVRVYACARAFVCVVFLGKGKGGLTPHMHGHKKSYTDLDVTSLTLYQLSYQEI